MNIFLMFATVSTISAKFYEFTPHFHKKLKSHMPIISMKDGHIVYQDSAHLF